MTTVTELSVSAADVALDETFTQLPNLEIRVKSVLAEGPLQTMPLVWIADEPREEIEASLAADPSVDDFTCLLEDPETREWLYRIEYHSTVGDLFGTIYEHEGTILDAQCSTSHWTFRVLFPDRDRLSNTVDSLERRGVRVDVTRVVEAGRNADLQATPALTDAQEEAISEAYRRGYYDVPRQISLEELADELDISHQALSERLRRANKVLASEQVDASKGEPVLE